MNYTPYGSKQLKLAKEWAVSSPRALQYSTFIEILYLMDAGIPYLPSESGTEFLIFRWRGSGTYPSHHGNSCPFIHRDNSESVPVPEIHKALNLLGISQDA